METLEQISEKVRKYIFDGTKLLFLSKFVHFSEIFWQNAIFRVKSTNFLLFSGPNVHFWVQN